MRPERPFIVIRCAESLPLSWKGDPDPRRSRDWLYISIALGALLGVVSAVLIAVLL